MFKFATTLLVAAVCHAEAAQAQSVTLIDVASTFPSDTVILGDVAKELPSRIAALTEGSLRLTFHEPGVLVPGAETVAAVADGRVAAAWAGAGWFSNRDSAFTLFSSFPFGPTATEYLAWMYDGGGLGIARRMFHAEGVHNIPCGLIPSEASGWFRQEIRTVADLKGLTMRFFGFGAAVMEKLGVETQQLPPGEILTAMKDNKLDATEFSLPAMDLELGFSEVAEYYYFPGWHQQATFFDIFVNLDIWQQLSSSHKKALELSCGDALRAMLSKGEAAQGKALRAVQNAGVQLKRWPPEMLVAFEDAWLEIAAEEAELNPNFAEIYNSYKSFHEDYVLWKRFSFLQ
ncbi:hypothetical protein Q669_32015 [Labrenzia sp. C1B10]|nr:hypothetical protein Q669_32015 [Labrenzia sp. C1B10]ERS04176.1 hypothetical protein Q675_30775 [Labrenzia sp. C1B70]